MRPTGIKVTTISDLTMSVSIRLTWTPPILYTFCNGEWSFSVGRLDSRITSKAPMRFFPSTLRSVRSTCHLSNQDILSNDTNAQSLCHPEIGTKTTPVGLYPISSIYDEINYK